MYKPFNKISLDTVIYKDLRLKDFLQSSDNDEIIVTDGMIENFKIMAQKVEIANELIFVGNDSDYELRIAHAFRSITTYHRLKKLGKNPSKTSQHFYSEAVDCHFYKNGHRVRDSIISKCFAEKINKLCPDMFLQIFAYKWGVHLSIETDRSKRAGIKSRFGIIS